MPSSFVFALESGCSGGEEAHFQSTLRPTPCKGLDCPLRIECRERFKRRSFDEVVHK